MIYLNNAQVTLQKPEIEMAASHGEENCIENIKKLFNAKESDKVYLTNCGKNSLKAMFEGFLSEGDHVITTVTEYGPCLDLLEKYEKSFVGVDLYGVLKYDEIEGKIRENTKAIICCHGSNVTGNVIDLERIGTIARRHKILVLVDGAQTAGAIPVDFHQLGIDAFAFTGQKKLMGPVGTGGLIVREGKGDNKAIESAVIKPENEKISQFKSALDFVLEKGIYQIYMKPHRHAKRFFEGVKSMTGVTVYGNFGTGVRVPTISLNIKGYTPGQVQKILSEKYSIVVKSGIHNAPILHEKLGTNSEGETGAVRFSFGYFNTRQDVNEAIWAIEELLGIDEMYLLG